MVTRTIKNFKQDGKKEIKIFYQNNNAHIRVRKVQHVHNIQHGECVDCRQAFEMED